MSHSILKLSLICDLLGKITQIANYCIGRDGFDVASNATSKPSLPTGLVGKIYIVAPLNVYLRK